eukprot:m.55538 g.55538  ORF g.55538 m.55538 type:complete len:54 (+) comp34484_c0_seq5:316-477(+)
MKVSMRGRMTTWIEGHRELGVIFSYPYGEEFQVDDLLATLRISRIFLFQIFLA